MKVLRTLQQMLQKKNKYGDRVSVTASPARAKGSGRRTLAAKSHISPFQGNQLRKMLLQNYLQNRKSGPRGELTDPTGSGQCHGRALPHPALPRPAWLALASNHCLSHELLPKAWIRTGQPSQPPSAGWTRRGPPSWCVISSPAPRTRRSSRRASAWPSACWTGATLRSRCGGQGRSPPALRELPALEELWRWGRPMVIAHSVPMPVSVALRLPCSLRPGPPRSTSLSFQNLIFLALSLPLFQSPNFSSLHFIHSFIHSFTHSFCFLFHSLIHSPTHSFTHSFTGSFIHSFTH